MKNMQKMLFTLILLFAVSGVAHAQSVRIVVNSVDPQPVEPGNDLTLKLTFTNIDKNIVTQTVGLDFSYPFSLKSSTESYENGFDLCGFCSRTNNYFMTVDQNARSGTYPIFIRIANQQGSSYTNTVNVTVRGTPNIILNSIPIDNATPASKFYMDINLTNIGTGFANQIKIVPKSSDFVSLGGIVAAVIPVSAGSSYRIVFEMSPSQELKAGSYNVPFEITYKDESGASYNTSQNIGVRVVNEGLLNIESIKVVSASGPPTAGQPVSVVVRLENIGHGNANGIESEVTCGGQKFRSFLGQLKRDEDAPALFDIIINTGGRHSCSLITTYSDDMGSKTLERSFDVNLNNAQLPVGAVVIVIILIAVAYYFIRKRRPQKK